jgi:polar amino acid transport system substrate-binding protein
MAAATPSGRAFAALVAARPILTSRNQGASMPWGLRALTSALAALVMGCTSAGTSGGTPSASTSGSPAKATRLARIVETGILRVGMTGEQPPLNMTAKSGEIVGMEVALVRVLAATMGVQAEIVRIPFPRLLDALEAGEIDLIMSGMTITAQRNLRVVFVGPYFVSGKSLLSKSTELLKADLNALSQRPLRLTALATSTSEAWVKRSLPQATLVPTETLDEGIDLVISDQADALVADQESCYYAMLRHRDAGLGTRAEALTFEPIGIALPPDDHQLANLVANYLDALETQGALRRAREFWFKDESWIEGLGGE